MKLEQAETLLKELLARKEDGLTVAELEPFIDDCFDLLEKHPSDEGKTRVAIIICSLVHRGLPERVMTFMESHPELPKRAVELLQGNLFRMGAH